MFCIEAAWILGTTLFSVYLIVLDMTKKKMDAIVKMKTKGYKVQTFHVKNNRRT
jgi:hypothetical protein